MIIRTAIAADIPAMVSMVNTAFLIEAFFVEGDRTSIDDVQSMMANDHVFYVAEQEETGKVIGTVYARVDGDMGHFGMLAVDPTIQRQGIARRLLGAVDSHCVAAGCRSIQLEVFNLRTELPPFYESCGYKAVGTREYWLPETLKLETHLIVMRKELRP